MTPKLSPQFKSVLMFNGLAPKGPPAPAVAQWLSTKKSESTARKLNYKVWLTIASATAFSMNSTQTVQNIYKISTSSEFNGGKNLPLEYKANAARIMREAGLKSTTIIGVARGIINMTGLHSVFEDDVKEAISRPSRRRLTTENITEVTNRGQAAWEDFYEPFQEKLYEKLSEFHPDFSDYIIQNHYGALLSNGANWREQDNGAIIGRALTSLVTMSCLRSQGGAYPQLLSHTFGLLKAGSHAKGDLSKVDELKDDVGEGWEWLTSPEGAEWVIKTVDELVFLITSTPHL